MKEPITEKILAARQVSAEEGVKASFEGIQEISNRLTRAINPVTPFTEVLACAALQLLAAALYRDMDDAARRACNSYVSLLDCKTSVITIPGIRKERSKPDETN